jgi:hypothetical protein
MRVLEIRSPADFGWWCLDQVGHAAIVDLAVIWFAGDWLDVLQAGAVILTIREGEQARDAVRDWHKAREAVESNLPISWDNRFATVIEELAGDGSIQVDGYLSEAPEFCDLLVELHLADRVLDIAVGTWLAVGAFQVARVLGWV